MPATSCSWLLDRTGSLTRSLAQFNGPTSSQIMLTGEDPLLGLYDRWGEHP